MYIKFFIYFLIIVNILYAEDVFDEFEDNITIAKIDNKTNQKNYEIFGSIGYDLWYSYQDDKQEISSSKTWIDLKANYKKDDNKKINIDIKAHKDFKTNLDKKTYFDINELYMQKSFNSFDITAGRQIITWGKSSNIQITDMINSLDKTAVGLVDIKDLKLGRKMLKLSYYKDSININTLILIENRYSILPDKSSEYYMPQLDKQAKDEPSLAIDNIGAGLSVNKNGEAYDISFYYLNQYKDLSDYRYNMLGFAYNKVVNSFLLKVEVAYFNNYDSKQIKDKIDGLVGFEYGGIKDGSISFEVANKDDEILYAMRFNQSYLNQILDFNILLSYFGNEFQGGGFMRSWIKYAVQDDISLTFGVIDYINGKSPIFKKLKDSDKVFSNLVYSF